MDCVKNRDAVGRRSDRRSWLIYRVGNGIRAGEVEVRVGAQRYLLLCVNAAPLSHGDGVKEACYMYMHEATSIPTSSIL